MKILAIGSLFVLFAIAAGVNSMPSAFADHATAEVQMGIGSGVPGCEETNECYIPYEVTVDVGGEVTWINEDAGHTVTAGDLNVDPSAVGVDYPNGFDSGFFLQGASFSHKFTEAGTYPYFCQVHPWMVGIVNVEDPDAHDDDHGDDHGDAMIPASIDEIMVTIETSDAIKGSPLAIEVMFTDLDGNALEHVNYELIATQGGETIIDDIVSDDIGVHSHDGSGIHNTAPLQYDPSDEMPVDISVELYGFGVDEITGPSGIVATKQVVPEFGTIAMMILGVAIVSIIALSAKSRVIPRI